MNAVGGSAEQAEVERRGAVAVLRFSNPPLGCIANKGAAQLLDALAGLLADPEIRAVVLTGGQEGIFIRHADVDQIVRAGEALTDGRIAPAAFIESPFSQLGRMLDKAIKPVIAAIDGLCMGGGLEIALACTIRIASSAARSIGLPEVRIGIFPGGGGTQRLPRLIGRHRARLFILKGSVVDAAEALVLGIVDEIAPSALDRALEVAEELTRRSPGAVAAIMRLTRSEDSEDGLAAEGVAFAELLRDDPAALPRLRRFLEQGERLEAVGEGGTPR